MLDRRVELLPEILTSKNDPVMRFLMSSQDCVQF